MENKNRNVLKIFTELSNEDAVDRLKALTKTYNVISFQIFTDYDHLGLRVHKLVALVETANE